MANPAGPRRGMLIALIVAALGIGMVYAIEIAAGGWVERYRSTLVSAIWLYLPLPFIFYSKKTPADYGISFGTGFRGLLETIAASIAVMVPFYAVFFYYFTNRWGLGAIPKNIFALGLTQFLVVGLPEEFFFRGFLQSELEGTGKGKWRILGADVGLGWLAAAGIFTLGHVVIMATPLRMAIIFPALLFGWARARTKSVIFPAFMHAVFNLTFYVAQRMVGY